MLQQSKIIKKVPFKVDVNNIKIIENLEVIENKEALQRETIQKDPKAKQYKKILKLKSKPMS